LPIAVHERGRLRVPADVQLQALVAGERREDALGALDQLVQLDGLDPQLLLAGLDLGQVEHLVDQRQQIVAGAVDRLAELDLLLAEVLALVLREQVGEQQHAVERRPQLV
jgi:hypothetical protein